MHKVLEAELTAMGDAGLAGAPDAIGDLFKRVYKKTGACEAVVSAKAESSQMTP